MVRTIACLPALVGAWRERGGGILGPTAWAAYSPLDQAALTGPAAATRARVNMVRLAHALTELEPPVHALVVYNSNPATTAPDSTRVAAGPGARGPLHGRARALPHRHGPLRRRRAAGDHAGRARRPRALVGPHVHHLQRAGHRAGRRGAAQHRDLPAPRARDGLRRRRPSTTATRSWPARRSPVRGRRWTSLDFERLRAVGWAEADLPEDFRPFAQGGFGTPSGRLRLWSEDLPPGLRPAAGRRRAAGADDRQERPPLPQLDLRQPAAPPGGRGRADARDASATTPRRAASPTATPSACATPAARSSRGRASATSSAPAWSRCPPAGGPRAARGHDGQRADDRGAHRPRRRRRLPFRPRRGRAGARTGRRGRRPGKSSSGGPMTRSRLFKLALPAAVVLGAGTAVAIAAIPSTSDGVIHGCYLTTTTAGQTVRSAARDRRGRHSAQSCATNEATLTWNQQGPVGPQGDPGPPGDSGTPTPPAGASATATPRRSTPASPGGPSADIFLALDGIPGDSSDAKHKNEIAIESFALPGQALDHHARRDDQVLGPAPGQGLRRVLAQALRRGDERAPHQERDHHLQHSSDTVRDRRPHLQAQQRHADGLRAGRREPRHQGARLAGGGGRDERRQGPGQREDVQRQRRPRPGR